MIKVAPLNSSFMVTSILGILISVIWVYKQAPAWGAAFTVVFVLMFISSIVSMTYGNADTEIMMDAPRPVKKGKKKKR